MTQNRTSDPSSNAVNASTDGPLIASDRVEGTAVYDPTGKHIGTIDRLMIDKVTGRVTYVVMGFGGFLGIGQDAFPVPWDKLEYDSQLGGYLTDITQEELESAPTLRRSQTAAGTATDPGDFDWNDRGREQALHDYYRVAYYWTDEDD